MRLSVSEAAKLTGISVRTLHYYDEIRLLSPAEVTEAGYRYYGEEELETLQDILFLRELDFPLKEIRALLALPGYRRKKSLKKQKKLLELQEKRLHNLILLAEKAIKGEKIMSFSEFKTQDFDRAKEKYTAEAKEKWGGTDAYRESEKKYAELTPEGKQAVMADMDSLIGAFSQQVGQPPESEAVQELVKQWQAYISEHHYTCTEEILLGLGEMYVGDERFQKNLDKYRDGTAQLMHAAIKVYCKS